MGRFVLASWRLSPLATLMDFYKVIYMEKIASFKDALKFVTDIISAKGINSTLSVDSDYFQVSLFIKHEENLEVVTSLSARSKDSIECLTAKCNGFAAIAESL